MAPESEPAALALFLDDKGLPDNVTPEAFVSSVIEQIVKDFDLDPERILRASIGVDDLLSDHIAAGLEGDPQPVFAGFYRLDLGEATVRQILYDHERPAAAKQLAAASLRRAALKVWTRLTYSP